MTPADLTQEGANPHPEQHTHSPHHDAVQLALWCTALDMVHRKIREDGGQGCGAKKENG